MLEKVIGIVKEAGKIMEGDAKGVIQKGDNTSNYVTAADLAIQEYLSKELVKLIPESSIVGEEGDSLKINSSYVWVIDPIDGTSNYIRKIGYSSISVGLVKDGKPLLGVVYCPMRNEMFYGEIGKGAFLNGERIYVSKNDFAHSHLCSGMSLYNKDWAEPCFRIIEDVYYKSDDLRRLGSAALELAYLAAGKVELYFEIRVFPWDVAGAIPIIMEAGGYIEYLYHENMLTDKPFGILAANNEENFEELKKIVHNRLPKLPY